MDTGSDFIKPEFFNILFFQQKNLVIFPYVDLKHLHGLEVFTVGYNVVDLESTALHNLKEILEFESTNSYSQNPTLYFIYNVDREKVKELMELDGIRCIINSNESIGNLANGNQFIFYNKKNNQFLNYDVDSNELEFEQFLINSSQDEDILQENIQKIKIATTRIFKELNQSGNLETLPDILSEYEKKYWPSIIEFTSKYYDINIPDISAIKFKPRKESKDFSDEYEVLISTNRALGKEFIQLLHEYRSKRVNPSHLELDELYNPQKLYNYLRNHHWKEGIQKEFVEEWQEMKISNYQLTETDQIDFEIIAKKLGLEPCISKSESFIHENAIPRVKKKEGLIPDPVTLSPKIKWGQYKKWISERINVIERMSNDELTSQSRLSLLHELSDLLKLIQENVRFSEAHSVPIPEPVKHEIMSNMKKFKIPDLVEIYGATDRYRFVSRFIAQFDVLYESIFGRDGVKDTPPRIKRFKFPKQLEKNLMAFNRFRNKITHADIPDTQINNLLRRNKKNIDNTYLDFLSYLLRAQIYHVAKKYNNTNLNDLNKFVMRNYLKKDIFSTQEINKIQELLK